MVVVKIDTRQITDEHTLHDVFAQALGFPPFYGRNMNAWIDCMRSLDEPSAGMTTVHASAGGVVVLQLDDVDDFAQRCPAEYASIVECAAFVNREKIRRGKEPVLALSFYKSP